MVYKILSVLWIGFLVITACFSLVQCPELAKAVIWIVFTIVFSVITWASLECLFK